MFRILLLVVITFLPLLAAVPANAAPITIPYKSNLTVPKFHPKYPTLKRICFWQNAAVATPFAQSGSCDAHFTQSAGTPCHCGTHNGTVRLISADDGSSQVVR
jgi:hypothetical protein